MRNAANISMILSLGLVLLSAPGTARPTTPTSGHVAASDTPNTDPAPSSRPRAEVPVPDSVTEDVGGIAARLRTADGASVPGDVYLLMATPGSDEAVRLYHDTPYTHDLGTAADSFHSNLIAVETVEAVTGVEVDMLEFTTAPGGGPSAGITYAVAYLNILSGGAFTDGVRVAATGRLGRKGYVRSINGINEKTAAAYHAAADVLFTPSTPTSEHLARYGARHVGELFRVGFTSTPLAEERLLDHYQGWGASAPDGLDVVGIGHIADVAAYLCGTGSTYACTIANQLSDDVTGTSTAATTMTCSAASSFSCTIADHLDDDVAAAAAIGAQHTPPAVRMR